MLFWLIGRLVVLQLALPLKSSEPVHSGVLPFRKVTAPCGTPPVFLPVKVAVKVIEVPTEVELEDDASRMTGVAF